MFFLSRKWKWVHFVVICSSWSAHVREYKLDSVFHICFAWRFESIHSLFRVSFARFAAYLAVVVFYRVNFVNYWHSQSIKFSPKPSPPQHSHSINRYEDQLTQTMPAPHQIPYQHHFPLPNFELCEMQLRVGTSSLTYVAREFISFAWSVAMVLVNPSSPGNCWVAPPKKLQ